MCNILSFVQLWITMNKLYPTIQQLGDDATWIGQVEDFSQ